MLRVSDSEGLAICTLDGVDQSLNLNGYIGLRAMDVGISLGHRGVPDWLFAYQVRDVYLFNR